MATLTSSPFAVNAVNAQMPTSISARADLRVLAAESTSRMKAADLYSISTGPEAMETGKPILNGQLIKSQAELDTALDRLTQKAGGTKRGSNKHHPGAYLESEAADSGWSARRRIVEASGTHSGECGGGTSSGCGRKGLRFFAKQNAPEE